MNPLYVLGVICLIGAAIVYIAYKTHDYWGDDE